MSKQNAICSLLTLQLQHFTTTLCTMMSQY